MKVGVIFVAWQCADLLPYSLAPWTEAKRGALAEHSFRICAVNVPFEGFPQDETSDTTRSIFETGVRAGDIDHVVMGDRPIKETAARGAALTWLMKGGVDITIIVDGDEFWTQEQIAATLAFIEANPWTVWFRVCYKQLVFTHGQWLKEPFTPPRVHRVHIGGYRAHSFCDDNDILYGGNITRDLKSQANFASMTVPQSQVWVSHDTWVSSPRTKAKVKYQEARWSECSFRWDDESNRLRFNEIYYSRRSLPLPEIVTE